MTSDVSTTLDTTRPSPWAARLLASSRTVSPRRAFWFSFLAFFALSTVWALANPLMASVDEPAHVIKAAATVRGASDVSADGDATGIGSVELPRLYEQLATYPNCFAFQPNASAACQQDLSGDTDSTVLVTTSAINYNPLYYAMVGWPALLPDGEHTVYLMRILNAALSSALLGFAVAVVSGLRTRRWLGVAILACLTPTFVNLMGSVNPQSVEVTGAVLLWVSLLALLRSPDERLHLLRLVGVVVSTLFVANARGLGPMLVVVILVLCILAAPWRRTVDLFRDRRSWWALGASVLACIAATAWILGADALPEGSGAVGIPLRENVFRTLGLTSAYVQQLFVALGWLDVGVPLWVIFLFVSTVAVLVFLAWAAGSLRDRLGIAGAATVTFLMPVLTHAVQADKIGYFWQGRYAFPIAIGILLVAGFALSERDPLPSWFTINLVATVSTAVVAAQVVVFYSNLHRYASGFEGGWVLTEPLSWSPVPAVGFTLLYAAAWAAAVILVARVVLAPDSAPADPTTGSLVETSPPGTTD